MRATFKVESVEIESWSGTKVATATLVLDRSTPSGLAGGRMQLTSADPDVLALLAEGQLVSVAVSPA